MFSERWTCRPAAPGIPRHPEGVCVCVCERERERESSRERERLQVPELVAPPPREAHDPAPFCSLPSALSPKPLPPLSLAGQALPGAPPHPALG